MAIYDRNEVNYKKYDPAVGEIITQAAKGLFARLDEFMSYPQVYFGANDAEFGEGSDLPASSFLRGDRVLLTQLFGIGRDRVPWNESRTLPPIGPTKSGCWKRLLSAPL
jgi:hypothetical protein